MDSKKVIGLHNIKVKIIEQLMTIFENSALNEIMKDEKMYGYVIQYSAAHWAIDVYMKYIRFS